MGKHSYECGACGGSGTQTVGSNGKAQSVTCSICKGSGKAT